MSGLFDTLGIASSALTAYQTGLDVVGQNISNINTPGYARRTLTLAERAPTGPDQAGDGVDVLAIQADRDQLIENRIGHEQAGLSHDSSMLDGLTEVNAAIGAPGTSIDASLDSFFAAFSQLSTDPTSAAARDAVVGQGTSLAQSFNNLSSRISSLQQTTDASIRADVTQLNQLTSQVAQLNGQILGNGVNVDALKDQRANVLSQLQQLADVTVVSRGDGAVDVTIAQGQALVIGANAYQVGVSSTAPSGFASLTLSDFDVTSQITNGSLGGLIQLRDQTLAGYQGNLDQLAYDVATQVNAVHATGFDANGNAGGAFFTPPATVAGAAAALAVDPGVAADSQLVAASGTGDSGDNQTARAIAALRDSRVMSGGTATPAEAWSNFVYRVGADATTAQNASGTRQAVVNQLQTVRDQTSGVSLDEEAALMMKYQRAYEASARLFTTVNSTLDTLLTMVP